MVCLIWQYRYREIPMGRPSYGEDTGIVLGQAFLKALGDKKGIARFGYFVLPMDDALVLASLDFSGRMYFCL